MHNNGKIIVIGFQRTGTTTLAHALLELGFTVAGTIPTLGSSLVNGNITPTLLKAKEFDVVQDLPWFVLFKELDKQFPNSKFILTKRDFHSWWPSFLNHFGNKPSEIRKWAYQSDFPKKSNQSHYEKIFEEHYKDVNKYFKNRPQDLLVLDIVSGDGWEKLCLFLKKPIPLKPFPFQNKQKDKYNSKDKFFMFIRKISPNFLRKIRLKILGKALINTD